MFYYSIEDLQEKLCEATGIGVQEQELLMASGQAVKPKTLVVDCIKNNQVRKKSSFIFWLLLPLLLLLLLLQESLTL